jgi:hypothetical protein
MAAKYIGIATDCSYTESFVWAEDDPVRRAAQNAVLYNDGTSVPRRVVATARNAV